MTLAKETNIKSRVVALIKEFRGLTWLTSKEVKINELNKLGDDYVVKGEYQYTGLLGTVTEKGTFEVTLRGEELTPNKVKVYPTMT